MSGVVVSKVGAGAGGGTPVGDDVENVAVAGYQDPSGDAQPVTALAPMPVSPVSGQAGVSVGAGAVDASTQRMTLASDDPLVTKTPALGQANKAASSPVTIASDQFLPLFDSGWKTLTTSSGSVYAAGDVVGGLMTFTDICGSNGGKFQIESMRIFEKTSQQPPLRLWLFSVNSITVASDNAKFDPTDADMQTCLGFIESGIWASPLDADNALNMRDGIGLLGSCDAADDTIYGVLVVGPGGTPTYGSTSDVLVRLFASRDI